MQIESEIISRFEKETARQRFVSLLSEGNITRPNAAVMKYLIFNKVASMAEIATKDEAVSLYEWAKNLPKTLTKGAFYSESGFKLDDPAFDREGMFFAFDVQTAPFIFKTVHESEDPEVIASKALSDSGKFLVPSRFLSLQGDGTHRLQGLIMPKYDRSLNAVDIETHPDTLLSRARDLVEALNFMHLNLLVHMDIKEANIFIDYQGKWWIGDFGSCVQDYSPIKSTTIGYHPDLVDWMSKDPILAKFEFDWYMLGALLIRQLDVQSSVKFLFQRAELLNRVEIRSRMMNSRPF